MNKIKQFFKNDKYKKDPVMCRKIQIQMCQELPFEVYVRVTGVEKAGRRMTVFSTLDLSSGIDCKIELAIDEFLKSAGLEK